MLWFHTTQRLRARQLGFSVPVAEGPSPYGDFVLYLVNIYTKDGNFWVEGEKFDFFDFDISVEEFDAACARNRKRKYIAQ